MKNSERNKVSEYLGRNYPELLGKIEELHYRYFSTYSGGFHIYNEGKLIGSVFF